MPSPAATKSHATAKWLAYAFAQLTSTTAGKQPAAINAGTPVQTAGGNGIAVTV